MATKKYHKRTIMFDVVLTLITGGLWPIFLLIRFIRTH